MSTDRRRAPVRWLRSVSMTSRLAMAAVTVSLLSLVAATAVGLSSGRSLTRELVEERLVALSNAGASDVAGHMNGLQRVGNTLALSPATAAAISDFDEAFDELRDTPLSDARDDGDELLAYYRTKYVEPITAAGSNIDLRDVLADDNAGALELQKSYAVPPEGFVDASQSDDARDGTAWSDVHRRMHPVYRDVVERQELVDLLLVEPDRGYVVYSYAKNADLGTSFESGPFGGSVIASAVNSALDDPASGTRVTDVGTYTPAVLDAVGGVVSPVLSDGDVVGIMVLVYGTDPLSDLLTVDGEWETSGFPESGETFLVGGDGLLRSEPRSFIEDRADHLAAAEEAGAIDADDRQYISVAGSTVLVERAVEDTVDAAIRDDDALQERVSATGLRSFNSSERVPIDDVEWYVVAEVERRVADGDLDTFSQWLVVGAAVFVVIVAFAAIAWSDRTLRPIRATSERLRSWEGGPLGVEVPERSPTELRTLVASFDEMLASLDGQHAELVAARERRVEMLRSLLPPEVAERVVSGDLGTVDQVEKATVAVLVVGGLGDLLNAGNGITNRALVDRVTGELDDLGERHGVERIKLIGDAYYAACGHGRPYIDHAPRVLAFVADARDAVREIGRESGHALDTVGGVSTGPVHVGITGSTGLVYDVWGPPVSTADNLARLGVDGQILVTSTTRGLLPDSVSSEEFDGDADVWLVEPTTVGGAV